MIKEHVYRLASCYELINRTENLHFYWVWTFSYLFNFVVKCHAFLIDVLKYKFILVLPG